LSAIIAVWTSSNINWGKEHWKRIVIYDAIGYYSYLPAWFIYQDMDFGFQKAIEEKYYSDHFKYNYTLNYKGAVLNKYPPGVALLQAPFFAVAHFFADEKDGFSKPYQIAVNMAGIFYFLAGALLCFSLLNRFKIPVLHQFWAVLATCFGTNLFYYVILEPGMSHVYSFFLVAAFINLILYIKSKNSTSPFSLWLLAGIVFGLIVAVRYINFFSILLIPVFFTLRELRTSFISFKAFLGFSVGTALVLAVPVFVFWNRTGEFFVDTYINEKFDFLNPHLFDFLFSYRKGWFLYSPVCLVGMIALLFLFWSKKNPVYGLVFSFVLFAAFLFSSWWSWWYGGSFGQRVMIDFYALIALSLAAALYNIRHSLWRRTFLVALIAFSLLNIFQTWQYRHGIIHWSDMNKAKYWNSFFLTPW
jgi:hypothetical protein